MRFSGDCIDNMFIDFMFFLIFFISDVKCDFDELDCVVVVEYEWFFFRKIEDDLWNSNRE